MASKAPNWEKIEADLRKKHKDIGVKLEKYGRLSRRTDQTLAELDMIRSRLWSLIGAIKDYEPHAKDLPDILEELEDRYSGQS